MVVVVMLAKLIGHTGYLPYFLLSLHREGL